MNEQEDIKNEINKEKEISIDLNNIEEEKDVKQNLDSNNEISEEKNIELNNSEKDLDSKLNLEENKKINNDNEQMNISNNIDDNSIKSDKTKKSCKGIILTILFIILIIATCALLVFVLIKSNGLKGSYTNEDKTTTKNEVEDITFNKETLPRVDAYVKKFTGKTVEEMGIEYTNTHPGYVKLINNEADLLIVTQPSDEELALAKEKNVELEVTKVVNEGFIFFTNVNNKVDNIKFKDLQKIYTGEITNWKTLGGSDDDIMVYQRPTNSGSQTGLLNLVMKGKKIMPAKTEEIATMLGIIEYVASYENGSNAIGYSYYYYANEMIKDDNIKYLAVDGVKPTYKTIQDESYPILTAYYIVTRKGDTNENVAKLKEAMLSKTGQQVAKEAGYVSIK